MSTISMVFICTFAKKDAVTMSENLSTRSRGRLVGAASHLIFILILFVLPEVMMAIAMPRHRWYLMYPGFYIKTLVYISVFYLNYLLVIDRTLVPSGGRRRIGWFVAINLVLTVVGLVLCYFITELMSNNPPRPSKFPPPDRWHAILKTTSFFVRDAVMLILTIALAVALRLSLKWKEIQRQRQELILSQRATELDNLKSQLNPHFLFNTLNTIYALISVAPDKAQGAVHRLSGLLRYMLYEDEPRVPLGREIEFIEDYVTLMRLRLSGRQADLNINIEGHEGECVPPLLFIPLVENAFKYGVDAPDDTPISLDIHYEDKSIVCSTSNAYSPARPESKRRSSGIGLANLRRRLALIYSGRASLTTTSDGHIYRTVLRIPL